MAGSQSLIGGGELPGLQLVAWAFMRDDTIPTVLKSFGVSSVSRLGSGQYRVNFSSPLPNASFVFVVRRNPSIAAKTADTIGLATTYCTYQLNTSGAGADEVHWVGIYQ